ncbi:MAG: dihydrolipoamide acetyltransferase family protein [Thermoplasmata archaeon]
MSIFKLPDIGEGVQEGEIVKWNVKEGDTVKRDQIIVEVMTDKVTVQIPSPLEGKVLKIYHKEGDIARVGEPLIEIGNGVSEIQSDKSEVKSEDKIPEKKLETKSEENMRVLAPPGIRRLARERGIDLTRIKGSGPNGRIMLSDIESFNEVSPPVDNKERIQEIKKNSEIVEMKGLRRIISEKMTKSKSIIPHYSVAEEVDVSELLKIRETLKANGINVSFTPFFVKAAVLALKEFPYLNARSLDDGKFELLKYYNIGIAVDTQEGLTVAVIKNADRKSIVEIAREIEDLASRAREGKLKLEEVKDSTFTVTNVGSIGGIFSTPIINYPEVAILGVHRVRELPNGKYMFITLSADHRLIDGAMAARFIVKVKKYLEVPVTVMV